jgi:hypothetical protein
MRSILFALLPATLVACSSSTSSTPDSADLAARASTQSPLGQPFELGAGKTASIDGTGLSITFAAVTAESRCPSTAICVWQGDAAIALKLARANRTVYDTLHTASNTSLAWRKNSGFEGYDVELVNVAPYPDGQPIPRERYVVTLRVKQQ